MYSLTTLARVKEINEKVFESFKRDTISKTELDLIEALEGDLAFEIEKIMQKEKNNAENC